MENLASWDQKTLVNELVQGRELAKQLQIHFHAPDSSHKARELLVRKIIRSYEKALSVLKSNRSTVGTSEYPHTLTGSPCSEESAREVKDQENNDVSRKRKMVSRWTQQVQVIPGTGVEGPLDDGYSWRKYVQKDILGTIYPRGYYRCTNWIVNGCLATKQVQRSDEDPTIFDITYTGNHTCTENALLTPSQPSQKQPPNTAEECHQPIPQKHSQEMPLNIQTGLKVVTEDLINSSSIYFPSTPNTIGSFSSPFVSPSTPASNYSYGENYPNFQNSEHGGPAGIISGTNLDLDHTFTFDDLDFFS